MFLHWPAFLKMKSELININLLKENPDNPRTITDAKFEQLVKSIKEFPEMLELRPIVVQADFTVLGGNMRLRACKAAGRAEVPVIQATSLSAAQIREFIIKDNVGFGEWEWEAIIADWPEAPEWGLDIPPFMLKKEAQEDDYVIPDEIETGIVAGDLFEIGQHRLLCGDSTKAEDVGKLMDGQKADMVFTDPPYGVSIGAKNRMLNSFQKAGRNLKDIEEDSASPDELYKILLPAFTNLRLSSKLDCTYFVTSPQGGGIGMMMMMMMMKSAGLEVRHVLIWRKNSPTFSMGRLDYDYQHEPIFLTWTKKHNWYGLGTQKTSVWDFDKPRANKEHPTMKPIALIGNALLNNSKETNICLDLFGGSGSTMIACHQLKRIGYLMEITPHYCQVIIDRMRKLDPDIVIKKNGVIYDQIKIP